MRIWLCGIVVVVSCLVAGSAWADVAQVSAAKDNTLYEDPAGSLSNGAGAAFFAGRTNQLANSRRRGVLQFDLVGQVPAGATITAANLTLHAQQGSGGPRTVNVHRVVSDWGEGASNAGLPGGSGVAAAPGDATWKHTFFSGSTWGALGGDFVATASAGVVVDGIGSYAWSSPALLADVQGWLASPATNFGWIVIGDESAAGTSKRFDSRESGDEDFMPRLSVEFTPVPEPATVLLAAIGGGLWMLSHLPRRRQN